MLTLCADVCDPNNVIPLTFKCAAIWAGPVSFAITKELLLINEDSCPISKAFSPSKTDIASNSFASFNYFGPGATNILYSFLYLSLIILISSL